MPGIENRDWSIQPPWQNMAEFGRSRESTKFHRCFPLFSTCTAFCSNLGQSGAIWGNLGQFACVDYLTYSHTPGGFGYTLRAPDSRATSRPRADKQREK